LLSSLAKNTISLSLASPSIGRASEGLLFTEEILKNGKKAKDLSFILHRIGGGRKKVLDKQKIYKK
jgi:hypothetical protein